MATGGIPLSEWSGSGATRELHETIKQQIASTDRQSKVIGRLTVFMAVLAAVQTIAAVVQIIPIFQSYQDKNANEKLCNSTSALNKQESQSPIIAHGQSSPAHKVEAPIHTEKKPQ